MMDQLGAQDAQFLYMESDNNLANVTTVSIYDPSTAKGGRVRFKDIIEHVNKRLHMSPLFRRRLMHVPMEWDYPYWVEDEHFDIEYHIRHGALPAPGDWRQFCIHLARYHSRPLDVKRPPWEMYVVEGLDNIPGLPKGSYAIATKIHHVAVDGHSMLNLFAAMSDIDANGTPVLDPSTFKHQRPQTPSTFDMLYRSAVNNSRSPMRIGQTLVRSMPSVFSGLQNAFATRKEDNADTKVPNTRFNVAVSPHKMVDARNFQLENLKRIRTLVPGCTINDVVLAMCSGALRLYLSHHNELPDDSLVAWVPINRRAAGSSEKEAPGNNISAMTVGIHTDVADPLQRLADIYASTQDSKEARSGVSARVMTDITRHVPAATQVMAAKLVLKTGLASKLCNLFVSNVPGPSDQIYMAGARVVGTMGMAPLSDGMGLFIATPSYNGWINFTVTSTREILPDIDFFMRCLEQSFDDLLDLTGPLAKPSRGKNEAKIKKARAKKTVANKPKTRASSKADANKKSPMRK